MKLSIFTTFYVAITVSIKSTVSDDLNRTPLCEKCKCFNKTLENPDVDCSEFAIVNSLYDANNWIDSKSNNSVVYPISSVNLQNNNLISLDKDFVNSTLTRLDLSHNKLNSINGSVFKNLQQLDVLILSYNELSSLTPEVFRGLYKSGEDYPLQLKTIKLDNNQLHTLNQDLFQHCEKYVENLFLSHNPFKVIDTATEVAINGIYNLKQLDLSHAQLKELPQHFFHTPKYLTVVNLSGNKFETVPKTLEDAHAIETLNFNENPIRNLTEKNGFPIMPTLKVLHMCRMSELEAIEKGALSGLGNLTNLIITNNIKLKLLHSAALVKKDVENEIWPPITKLHISNNQLTHLDRHFLIFWDRLVDLDIRGNPWTCECENQWILDELMQIYAKVNLTQAKEVACAAPIEMLDKNLYNLTQEKYDMRCLDLYGNRPERDGALLIGMLAGILIAIPLVLFGFYAYQRKWFGLFDNSPASYSRNFYGRTASEEFHEGI